MAAYQDLLGTTRSTFRFGKTGPQLIDAGSNVLAVRNTANAADAPIRASRVDISGDSFVLNSDAAGAGADWSVTIQRAASGMTANHTYTWPAVQTDGVLTNTGGVLTWGAGGSSNSSKIDTTTIAFGAGTTTAMFTTAVGDVITEIQVIPDTVFDGTPTLSIGIAGTVSKYAAASDIDLAVAAGSILHPCLPAGGVEALIATYAAGGATVGSARILVTYGTPN